MTAVDLTPGATLANNGEITTTGRIGIGGAVSQYPVTGEVPAVRQLVCENNGFDCRTGYGGVIPDHSHVAWGTQGSPTAPGANTIFRDMAGRLFWNGQFGGSSATFQYITTEAVTSTYTGCKASLQLTPNGGGRQETHVFYGSGDFIMPVAGSRLLVGASVANQGAIGTTVVTARVQKNAADIAAGGVGVVFSQVSGAASSQGVAYTSAIVTYAVNDTFSCAATSGATTPVTTSNPNTNFLSYMYIGP